VPPSGPPGGRVVFRMTAIGGWKMLKWLFGIGSTGAEPVRKRSNRRGFLLGMVCGAALVIVFDSAQGWFAYRSPEDASLYDGCLYRKSGNRVACDAFLRWYHHESGQ
jgi:hypothetical protein